MAWTLRTIWLDLRYGLPGMIKLGRRSILGSRLSSSPSVDATAPERRFYSLMIAVRPAEADAETLRLFSDNSFGLTEALHLPDGCEIRRCMIVSADFAEMLIRCEGRAPKDSSQLTSRQTSLEMEHFSI